MHNPKKKETTNSPSGTDFASGILAGKSIFIPLPNPVPGINPGDTAKTSHSPFNSLRHQCALNNCTNFVSPYNVSPGTPEPPLKSSSSTPIPQISTTNSPEPVPKVHYDSPVSSTRLTAAEETNTILALDATSFSLNKCTK